MDTPESSNRAEELERLDRLAAAILVRTVEEWEDQTKRSDIEIFLTSEWFNGLAELIRLNPKKIREQLLDGSYNQGIDTRAAYR